VPGVGRFFIPRAGVVWCKALPYEGEDQRKAPMRLPCVSRTAAVSSVRAVWRTGHRTLSGRCRNDGDIVGGPASCGVVGGAQPPQRVLAGVIDQHTTPRSFATVVGGVGPGPPPTCPGPGRASRPCWVGCRRRHGWNRGRKVNSATNPSAGSVKILSGGCRTGRGSATSRIARYGSPSFSAGEVMGDEHYRFADLSCRFKQARPAVVRVIGIDRSKRFGPSA